MNNVSYAWKNFPSLTMSPVIVFALASALRSCPILVETWSRLPLLKTVSQEFSFRLSCAFAREASSSLIVGWAAWAWVTSCAYAAWLVLKSSMDELLSPTAVSLPAAALNWVVSVFWCETTVL